MDLIYRFHQAHSLLRRLIDHMWSLTGNYEIVLNEKLQIGISRSEVEVCLIYHFGLARSFYANSKNLGDDLISISFHRLPPFQS